MWNMFHTQWSQKHTHNINKRWIETWGKDVSFAHAHTYCHRTSRTRIHANTFNKQSTIRSNDILIKIFLVVFAQFFIFFFFFQFVLYYCYISPIHWLKNRADWIWPKDSDEIIEFFFFLYTQNDSLCHHRHVELLCHCSESCFFLCTKTFLFFVVVVSVVTL